MWPDTEGNHATSDEQPLRESGLRPSRLSPFFFPSTRSRRDIFGRPIEGCPSTQNAGTETRSLARCQDFR